MFGALATTRGGFYGGHISSKKTSFGRIAIGIAKGTAMIVVGVPVVTVAAGLGASAIVAYGLASPFVYGGKKLIRKIRRRPLKRKCCIDGSANDDILTLDPVVNPAAEDEEKVFICYVPSRQSSVVQDIESRRLTQSLPASYLTSAKHANNPNELGPPPTFRRLISREKGVNQTEPVLECDNDADLWSELDSVVHNLEPDRQSLPENFVATDMPLNLDSEQDILNLAERMQLSKLAGPEISSLPDLRELGGYETEEKDGLFIDTSQQALSSAPLSGGSDSSRNYTFGRPTTYTRMLSNLSSGSANFYL